MNIDLSTDTAPYPERTLQLAETMADIIRELNHQTLDHEALRYPSEADRLLRELSAAAARLPQLLGQVTSWLHAEVYAGRVEMASGSRFPNAGLAEDVVRLKLEAAAADAGRLQKALDAAASVTSDMAAREDESDELTAPPEPALPRDCGEACVPRRRRLRRGSGVLLGDVRRRLPA